MMDLKELRRVYNTGYETVSGGLSMSMEAHEAALKAVDVAVREQIARDIGRAMEPVDRYVAVRIARGES